MKNRFTPLESPTASSGDGDVIPFGANTGFRAPCEPSRRKAADLLTGFTGIIAVFLLVTLLSPASSAVSGEIYKWKDKDGNIVFSDTPPPPGVNAEKKEFKEESTERPKTKEYFSKPISERVEEKRPYRDIHVIMYMTSWCSYCVRAREYLRSLDVNLIEYNIERDKSKREEMLSKSGGSSGVPLIDVEGIIIRGYNTSPLRAAIERRRSL